MKATVLDLRRKTREIIEALDRGETVALYYRGHKKADIVPIRKGPISRDELMKSPMFGMWKDREDMADVEAYIRKLRKPRYAL